MVVFNNRLYMTELTQERKNSGTRSNGPTRPKHLMDTSHVSASPTSPDRFKIEIRTDTVTDADIALEGFVGSNSDTLLARC